MKNVPPALCCTKTLPCPTHRVSQVDLQQELMSSGAPCSTAREIEEGGETEEREKDVQIGLNSPDGLLDKSRQMEIFTRRAGNQDPVVQMPLNMDRNL